MGTKPVPTAGLAFSFRSIDDFIASTEASAENFKVSRLTHPDRRIIDRRIDKTRRGAHHILYYPPMFGLGFFIY
jgi:hypothetical protein